MRGDELRQLFDAVELAARRDRERGRTTWPRRFAMLTLLRYAGLRVGELATLRVGDLELHADRARVAIFEGKYRKRPGKRGARRKPDFAPLAAEAVPTLRDYLAAKETWGEPADADAWLFPSRGGHVKKRAIQTAFKKALELAGLPLHYSPHALRHSYGVYLYRHTKDLRLVQKALRHKRSTTTETYADVLAEDVHAGVNGAFAEGEATPEPTPADDLLQKFADLSPEQREAVAAILLPKRPATARPTTTGELVEKQKTKKPTSSKPERRQGADRRTKPKRAKPERRQVERRSVKVTYDRDESGKLVKRLPTRSEFIAEVMGWGTPHDEAEKMADERAADGLLRENGH
jgi:hypothetical protein